jgi:hypothetical protein
MEDALSSKMSEFMTALDQVKKYCEIVASMTDFILIILGSVVVLLSFNIAMRLSGVFIVANQGQHIAFYFLYAAIVPAGIIVAVWHVRRRVKAVKTREWKTTLNEGAAGALKIIQELEWESLFSSIRYAKLGFFLYGISRILACWGIAIIALYGINWGLPWLFHTSMDQITMVLLGLGLVVFLNRNGLRKRYEQIGRFDWLMWELRWFESEFRGANFEA